MTLLVLPSPRAYAARPEFDPAELTHQGHRGWLAPAPAALGLAWVTDAHCQAATATIDGQGVPWRLSGASLALPGIEVAMGWAIFDVDGPNHQRSAAWDDEIRDRLVKLPGLPHCFATRGGCRIMWRLGEPFAIKSTADAAAWKRTYLECCAWLARLGIEADKSCADWSRLFRLPRVRRDGVDVAPDFELGDPEAIGVLEIDAVIGDHRSTTCGDRRRSRESPEARELSRSEWRRLSIEERAERATGADGAQRSSLRRDAEKASSLGASLEPAPLPGDGACRLLDACAERGLLGERIAPRVWRVSCPNAAAHSTPSDTARLYTDQAPGTIHCFHQACQGLTRADWLGKLGADLERVPVRAVRGFDNVDHLRIELEAIDDDRAFEVRVRIPRNHEPACTCRECARWSAWWSAVDPDQAIDETDLRAACRALAGRPLVVELDGIHVARFHPA